jgi:hypothetical protein
LQDDDDITNYDETTSKSDKFTHAIVDAPVPAKKLCIDKLNVKELRTELKIRKLKTTGKL